MLNLGFEKVPGLTSISLSLVLPVAVFLAEIVAFTVLRAKFKTIYEPRTFIPPLSKRAPPLPPGFLSWPIAIYNLDPDDIRRQNGLDAYVFVHFLRMMVKMLLPIWFLSWTILLPINSVRHEGLTGLDRFTFGNISRTDQSRYAAHLTLAYVFTFWILYVLKKEMRHFITVRQRHLIDPGHRATPQAKTMLMTGVPPKYLHPLAIRSVFSLLPGGVDKVWVNRDLRDLPDLFDERLDIIAKLESAETTLMHIAAKLERKRRKGLAKRGTSVADQSPTAGGASALSPGSPKDAEKQPLSLAERFVPANKRPTHRLKLSFLHWLPFSLPFFGEKVDTIQWCREEISRLNALIRSHQDRVATEMASEMPLDPSTEMYPRLNSAFVLFNEQIAAHIASQALVHHEPYRMAAKYTEVAPKDVIWSNLNMNPYEAKIRTGISYTATAGLILLWAFPVAFIGAVSNVHSLCSKYRWLTWVCHLPGVVIGIISGIIPPVLLALLMMLLPIILRLLAQFEGIPRRTGLELSLMTRFFTFQVIHSFLIVTLSAGLVQSLAPLAKNLGSAPTLLANNLPGASTFFLTRRFLQLVPLIIYYVKLFLLGSTPRSVYAITHTLQDVQWGTLFPSVSLIVVITVAYSVISPLINGLACAIFFLLYQTWKYLFLYVLDQPPSTDTGGLFFPKAITHVFVGLYVEQICLAALFFLTQDARNHPSAVPEGALMVVLIVITAGFHIILLDSYAPLFKALPLTLAADRSHQDEVNARTSVDPSVSDSEDRAEDEADIGGATTGVDKPNTAPPRKGLMRRLGSSGLGSNRRSGMIEPEHPRLEGEAGLEFMHPALGPARIVWIPKDTTMKIDVSLKGASMDEGGHVDVEGPPPGEEDAAR
ncbi:uncharacterized protein EI90DRAFT_3069169 [Cantharellus anzutake]|uniref:uncharacterized protein n=1 Tax=Cantharellus anzutake TaxID=1750568 RepID=UPI00190851C1|nr:uncharacterized protein EI90DRAFT_3069169 [Cantharellus anzutake]KAF8326818.1 hypothetical protein EI90DRAFT_3069169 [Cantharellus anzutake]